MCASYRIEWREDFFPLVAEMQIDIRAFAQDLIVPHRLAPVYVQEGDKRILTPMRYSLLPSWSKEPKVKFATHNARLESIDEKPTWKEVFVKRHCLVPLSEFIEPIYEGEHAGHMVAFGDKGGDWIYAAGLWDEWVNRQSGEVIHTFAIITSEPPRFVAETGHDRCPVFLTEKGGREWLQNVGSPSAQLKKFLTENKTDPDYVVSRQRPMKPGWEKRK